METGKTPQLLCKKISLKIVLIILKLSLKLNYFTKLNAFENIGQVTFRINYALGQIIGIGFPEKNLTGKTSSKGRDIHVQCFPLYSILLAVGRTSIDFFSLDVEGHELLILKTIPFDKVHIKVSYSVLKSKILRNFNIYENFLFRHFQLNGLGVKFQTWVKNLFKIIWRTKDTKHFYKLILQT